MKNLLLSFGLLGLMFLSALNAATFGLAVSVNASRLSSSGQFSEVKYGTSVGIYYDVPLASRLFLTNEILITNIGAKYTRYLYDIPYITTFKLKYLEVPLLLHWQAYSKNNRTLFLLAGTVLGFNLNKSVETQIASLTVQEKPQMFDPANWTFTLGAGVVVNQFRVYLKYHLGVISIISTRFGEARPSYLSLTIGLPFR